MTSTRNDIVCGFLALLLGLAFVIWSRPGGSATAATAHPAKERLQDDRFDMLVRDDFFAGMMGNTARLDRGMKYCEEILAKNPRHAEALVWHGGGLIARAARAYTRGDSPLGDRLWKTGIEEMNNAVIFEPENMGVKIGRAATLVGLAQSGWDPSDSANRALLESALLDYEKVFRWQQPRFSRVSDHGRGELLFGLASGWSILGNQTKARDYLKLVLRECKDTTYESEAKRWLSKEWPVVIQHDCIGCHVSR